MTRYFATSAATRRHAPLTSGFDTEAEARAQAEFLARTYGGVGKVSTTERVIAKFSVARGWH